MRFFKKGDEVIGQNLPMKVPKCPNIPATGVVARNQTKPKSISVCIDGYKSATYWHSSFWRRVNDKDRKTMIEELETELSTDPK